MFNFKQRWQIETLFRGLKRSGFNIEDTHVKDLEGLKKSFLFNNSSLSIITM